MCSFGLIFPQVMNMACSTKYFARHQIYIYAHTQATTVTVDDSGRVIKRVISTS